MALNFGLMNPDLPGQIAGSFQQGYQGAQDRANVLAQRQQQRQIADMEMQNALRVQKDAEARRNAYGAINPIEVANRLRGAGFGEEAMNLEQKNREQVAQVIRDGAKTIAANPSSYKSVFQRVKQTAGIPLDDDEKRYDEAFATGGEAAVRKLAAADAQLSTQVVGGSIYNPSTGEFTTPQKQSTKLVPILVGGQPVLVPEEQAVGQIPANAQTMRGLGGGRASAGGGTSATGRAPSGYRFTPTGELEPIPGGPAASKAEGGVVTGKPMTELQQRKAKQEQVTELQGVKAARSVTSELEKLTDELAGNPEKGIPPHPGYKRIVGVESIFGSLPGGDAARAEQKLETFKGKISTFGRQLATQFGKLGNMAVQEWKIVSDSVQNINPRAGNLDEQMRDVVRQAQDFERTMQDKYDALYGNERDQPSAPTGAKPTTAPKTTGNPYSNLSNEELLKRLGGGK